LIYLAWGLSADRFTHRWQKWRVKMGASIPSYVKMKNVLQLKFEYACKNRLGHENLLEIGLGSWENGIWGLFFRFL